MPIHFVCPFGHKLIVPDHRAGKKGRCPTCEQRVLVPVPRPQPLGPNGEALNAGPNNPVQLDPTDIETLGFDEQALFDEVAAQPGTVRPKKSRTASEAIAEESEAEAGDDFAIPRDSEYDPDLFANLPDEPNARG